MNEYLAARAAHWDARAGETAGIAARTSHQSAGFCPFPGAPPGMAAA